MYDTDEEILDPQGILDFLIDELEDAEDKGLGVMLLGHTAAHGAFPAQSRLFDEILTRFKDTIVTQFFGDSHMSTFEIAYSPFWNKTAANAAGISITSGSVTPFGGFANPGFRALELDSGSGEIWDWHDYYTNITDPAFQHGPKWERLFSAREAYLPLLPAHLRTDFATEPLTPAFWHHLADAFEASEPAFRTYIAHKYRASPWSLYKACRNDACRKGTICAMRRTRSEYFCFRDPDESPHLGDAVVPPLFMSALDADFSQQDAVVDDHFDIFDILRHAGAELRKNGSITATSFNLQQPGHT